MKNILYVEDNNDTANAVKIILNNSGFSTDIAATGKEGFRMVKEKNYDLILLDVMLPDMSGWDIYGELKNSLKVKFAFLSAIPISSDRMQGLFKEGVADYILKPFAKADLVDRIKRILP